MKEAALWNSANQGDKGVISPIQGDLIEYFPQITFMGEKTINTTLTRFWPQEIKRINKMARNQHICTPKNC